MKTNVIYNEDCLKTLERLPDNSVDIVITSPPYNMNLRIRKGEYTSRQIVKEFSTKYDNFDDNLPIEKYYEFHSKVLKELLRVSDLIFYNVQIVTGSKRAVFKLIGDLRDNLKDIIIWDKGHGQPSMQKQVLNKRTELLLIFEKDYPISRQFRKRGNFDRGTLDDLWLIPRDMKRKDISHKATFPRKLVARILENFSRPNDIVYDPFIGIGTTAMVAHDMGRRYIGSEINKDYVDYAEKILSKGDTFWTTKNT